MVSHALIFITGERLKYSDVQISDGIERTKLLTSE